MKVRFANKNDVPLISAFISQKAEFDRNIGAFSEVLQVTEERLQKTLFGAIPFSYILFAESRQCEVGFALYGFRFSSFVGQPNIWLDDLYVQPTMRSQGAGSVLMSALVQIAKNNDCTHLAWNADARNDRGLKFYDRLGAKITDQQGDRCFWRWDM